MQWSDQELVRLNGLGLIPGPEETDLQFKQRVDQAFQGDSHFTLTHLAPQVHLHEALNSSQLLFDIYPIWAKISYSNQGLRLWQGGATWIERDENLCYQGRVQLRKTFKNHERYLFLYERQELIAHELAHFCRLAFDEPIYEEFLAYKTSRNPLRSRIGIFLSSSRPLWGLLGLMILPWINLIFQFRFDDVVFAASLIFLALLGGEFTLGCVKVKRWQRATSLIKSFIREESVRAVAYRLTDREIFQLSKMEQSQFKIWLDKKKEDSLRWRMIYQSYFLR